MTLAAVVLLLTTSEASVDRTGRHVSARRSRVAEGVRCITVQVGPDDKQDIHFRWEKDFTLRGLRTHVAARTSWPKNKDTKSHVGDAGVMDSITLSGSVLDVAYEAKHSDGATDIQVAYSLPGGLQVMSDVTCTSRSPSDIEVKSVSAFHTAGAFNLQPTWNFANNRLRIKLGRGMRRFACPVSVTADFDPDEWLSGAEYEFGVRQELTAGRMLRAKLLLPAQRAGQKVWAEIRDNTIDEGGSWIAQASVPVGRLDEVEFTLRRAWQF